MQVGDQAAIINLRMKGIRRNNFDGVKVVRFGIGIFADLDAVNARQAVAASELVYGAEKYLLIPHDDEIRGWKSRSTLVVWKSSEQD